MGEISNKKRKKRVTHRAIIKVLDVATLLAMVVFLVVEVVAFANNYSFWFTQVISIATLLYLLLRGMLFGIKWLRTGKAKKVTNKGSSELSKLLMDKEGAKTLKNNIKPKIEKDRNESNFSKRTRESINMLNKMLVLVMMVGLFFLYVALTIDEVRNIETVKEIKSYGYEGNFMECSNLLGDGFCSTINEDGEVETVILKSDGIKVKKGLLKFSK